MPAALTTLLRIPSLTARHLANCWKHGLCRFRREPLPPLWQARGDCESYPQTSLYSSCSSRCRHSTPAVSVMSWAGSHNSPEAMRCVKSCRRWPRAPAVPPRRCTPPATRHLNPRELLVKWLLAGASGFLGTAIRVRLASEGEQVVRLVRREPATATEFRWDPDSGDIDAAAFDDVDVVVNLGGVPVAPLPWTESRREHILSSRVNTTRTMARGLAAQASSRSRTLIQASGIARYGTTSGVEPHTEESPAAVGFLAQVTTKWEAATQPASDAGVRVVMFRTSPVMDASGGSLVPMKLAWWSGLGAVIGDGSQRMPMISLRDYLAVMHWAATNDQASGPYNLTLREPTTNAEFS